MKVSEDVLFEEGKHYDPINAKLSVIYLNCSSKLTIIGKYYSQQLFTQIKMIVWKRRVFEYVHPWTNQDQYSLNVSNYLSIPA